VGARFHDIDQPVAYLLDAPGQFPLQLFFLRHQIDVDILHDQPASAVGILDHRDAARHVDGKVHAHVEQFLGRDRVTELENGDGALRLARHRLYLFG